MKPILDKATAKLAVIVDFPTPPFPEETAIILLIPGICFPLIVLASSFEGASTLIFTLTFASAFIFSAITFLISASARFFICKAGVVKTTSTTISSPKVTTFCTAPLSTIFLPSPAIEMLSNAVRISFLSNFISIYKNLILKSSI